MTTAKPPVGPSVIEPDDPIDWSDGKAPAGRVIDDVEQDKLADDVMDDILWGKYGAQTEHTTRSQEEEEIREEQAFTHAFAKALSEQLGGAGLRCTGMMPDGEGNGFVIRFHDAENREFRTFLTYDDYLERSAIFGADAGRVTLMDVCERVLQARAEYFRRMS